MKKQSPNLLKSIKSRSLSSQHSKEYQTQLNSNPNKIPPWQIFKNVEQVMVQIQQTNDDIIRAEKKVDQTRKKCNKSIFKMTRCLDYKNYKLSDQQYRNLQERLLMEKLQIKKQENTITQPSLVEIEQPLLTDIPVLPSISQLPAKHTTQHDFTNFLDRNYYSILRKRKAQQLAQLQQGFHSKSNINIKRPLIHVYKYNDLQIPNLTNAIKVAHQIPLYKKDLNKTFTIKKKKRNTSLGVSGLQNNIN